MSRRYTTKVRLSDWQYIIAVRAGVPWALFRAVRAANQALAEKRG
jgi:hypothetical protein